jgi:hypothetical protein
MLQAQKKKDRQKGERGGVRVGERERGKEGVKQKYGGHHQRW